MILAPKHPIHHAQTEENGATLLKVDDVAYLADDGGGEVVIEAGGGAALEEGCEGAYDVLERQAQVEESK